MGMAVGLLSRRMTHACICQKGGVEAAEERRIEADDVELIHFSEGSALLNGFPSPGESTPAPFHINNAK